MLPKKPVTQLKVRELKNSSPDGFLRLRLTVEGEQERASRQTERRSITEARRAGQASHGLTNPSPPPCSNTKCYYIIDIQFIILFFMIICFYIAVRKSEIKMFQKKISI